MKSPIVRFKGILLTIAILSFHLQVFAQAGSTNPGEYAVLSTGNIQINNIVNGEILDQMGTSKIKEEMSRQFTNMKKWEKQYNGYLKAQEFGSAIYAASNIYTESVLTFIYLSKIYKACSNNPEGIAATLSMNNLYAETFAEMCAVYDCFEKTLSVGGKDNMLTGTERVEVLWTLKDRLESFNQKLRQMYYSLRHYRMGDVWLNATAGMIDRDKADIAERCLTNFKRTANEVTKYGD